MLDDDFVMIETTEVPDVSTPKDHSKTTTKDHLKTINEHIESLSDDLRHISISIHDNPELQYKEYHAHKVLTNYLAKQDWKVTPSAYGIETAFVAVYDTGRKGPVVSFNAEYDALAKIGHACGHNLIAIVSLGGALAAAKTLEDEGLGGKIVLFGTPAEEGGGGKIKLLEAGAYKDLGVDISLITHPGITPDAALMSSSAYTSFKVEYFGKEAHAAARPWDGINALDALITAYNGISVLRQQTQSGDIIQGMITNGGLRPNIIHAYAAGRFVVRSDTKARRSALLKRALACFEAGATATGATLKVTTGTSYDDHMPNRVLGESYRKVFNKLGGEIPTAELDYIVGRTQASTDQGNVSYAMASISPSFWIRSEDKDGSQLGGPHTPDFEVAARSLESHELAKRAAKSLAAVAVDVVATPKLLDEAKREFNGMTRHEKAKVDAI